MGKVYWAIHLLMFTTSCYANKLNADQTIEQDSFDNQKKQLFSKGLGYNLKSTVLSSEEEDRKTLASYFGETPLCYDSDYTSCTYKAQQGFKVCSGENKACQCYLAGSAIVECSKYCTSYTNPYILQYDESLYKSYNNKDKKSHHLIKELHKFKNTILDAQAVQNLSEIVSTQQDELAHALFDFSLIDDTTKQFERGDLVAKPSAAKTEEETFDERENIEKEKQKNKKTTLFHNPSKNTTLTNNTKNHTNQVSKDKSPIEIPVSKQLQSEASRFVIGWVWATLMVSVYFL